jgi:hypothetical protein
MSYTFNPFTGNFDSAPSGGGGAVENGTADGQMAYWDNTAGEWKHTETDELFWDDTNKLLKVSEATVYGNNFVTSLGKNAAASSIPSGPGNVVAIGTFACVTNSGDGATAVGKEAMRANSGNFCTGIGKEALETNSQVFVTAVGYEAGQNNGGSYSVMLGAYAGENNGGFRNTLVGQEAGQNNAGNWNVGIGSGALDNNDSSYCVGIGANTMNSNVTNRSNSIAIGYQSMRLADGIDCIAIGRESLESNDANYCIGIGRDSLTANTGNYNVAIGHHAGTDHTSGSNNVYLGALTGDNVTTGSSNILIGYDIAASAVDVSNELNIGNTLYGDLSTNDLWQPNDSDKFSWGAGKDMSVYYDGTDGWIKTDEVAASDLNISCGTDKTIELQETVWDDINLGAAQLSQPASNQPDIDTFVDNTGTDTGIETYAFATGEKVHGEFELIHTYKEGTDLKPHIHFQIKDTPSGTDYVRWRITYTIAKSGNTLSPVSTIEGECAVDTQYENYFCTFPDISGTGLEIGDQFLMTLERITATGDAFTGDALLQTVGIHHEVDTMGSRQIASK